MSFPVTVGLNYGDEKLASTVSHGRALGTRGVLPDGRVFYWSQNGAVALAGTQIVQTRVTPSNSSAHVSGLDVVGVTATGVSTITVTIATTNTTADLYADGFLTIDTSPGTGMYRVKSHPAVASAADGVFTLDEKLREALTSGTTKVGFRPNPYADVIEYPVTTATGVALGICPIPVAIASFFWLQTFGPALVNTDVAPIAGVGQVVPSASAGTAAIATSVLTNAVLQNIGYAPTAAAGADKYNYIFLSIRA